MAELLRAIEERRAFRALSDKPVPREVIERVMKAAILAPSCFNNQPWRFLVCSERESLEKIKLTITDSNYWARKSPFIIAACTKPSLDCRLNEGRDYAFFCLGLAVENLQLQAVHEGLSAHPIAGFRPDAVRKAFLVPEDYVVLTLIILGYPGDPAELNEHHRKNENSERSRKPIETVVSFESWNLP